MRKLLILGLIVLLSGCASVGAQVKTDQLNSLTKGETTIDEVQARFGRPTSTLVNSDGTKILQYIYVHSQTRPQTFIPVVGAFVGGADTKSNVVTLTFNRDGRLLSYTGSETQLGSGIGASAGSYQAPIPDQPRAQE